LGIQIEAIDLEANSPTTKNDHYS